MSVTCEKPGLKIINLLKLGHVIGIGIATSIRFWEGRRLMQEASGLTQGVVVSELVKMIRSRLDLILSTSTRDITKRID